MTNNTYRNIEGPVCPIPLQHEEQIILGHGSGGLLTQRLIREVFYPYLSSPPLLEGNDFALVDSNKNNLAGGRISISTDAHVISPLFYPGGDIGRLSVCGTVNDVAMSGAIPLYLTASFIIEEGLPTLTLIKVLESMREAAEEAGVQVIAGDTKVVERGKADKLFITTTGVGWIADGVQISGANARPGDAVLVSGTIGDHGIAVIAARGGLGLEIQVQSDQAPLNHMIQKCLSVAPNIHVLRDPTRGGVATTLNEIAHQSQVGIELFEDRIPVNNSVDTACQLLGFDPLYIANEGKVIIILPQDEAQAALYALHQQKYGTNAALVGKVTETHPERVLLTTRLGVQRVLDSLTGEMLPRIC